VGYYSASASGNKKGGKLRPPFPPVQKIVKRNLLSPAAVMLPVDDFKIRAASVVNPNPVPRRSPAIALRTGGFAVLRYHPHFGISRFNTARVPSHVAGTARDHLRISVMVVISVLIFLADIVARFTPLPALILKRGGTPHCKIRAASMVHPNALLIGAPAVAFRARRFASLCQQSHSASRVERARVPSFIIGVAADSLRASLVPPVAIFVAIVAVGILVVAIRITIDYFRVWGVSIFTDRKIRAASVIHPNSTIVNSPAVVFGTSGVAVLRRHAHSASCIDGARVAPHIVGAAGNRGLAQRFLRDEQTNTQQRETQVKTSVLHDC
jgi:hypothetical protein